MNFTEQEMLNEILYYNPHYVIHDLDCIKNDFYNIIEKNKQTIQIKDLIYNHKEDEIIIDTPDGYQPIGDFWIKNERVIKNIFTENYKNKLSCSNDHLIETDNGWYHADELSIGDNILTKNGLQKIISIVTNDDKEIVYDFEVEHENHRYWAGTGFDNMGISSHNTGKTYLALNSAREAQKMGYYIIWIDTENAVDIDMMERFGINSELVDYQPVDDISMAINLLRNIAEQLNIQRKSGGEMPKIFVVLDSLGNLSTSKEKADTLSGADKKDMTRPAEIKKLFRVMIRDFGILKIPCVITNHTHKDIGSFITQDVIGGGGGAEYNPSVTLMLSKAQLKEDNVTKTGIIVTSKLKKSRFTREIPIKFHISFLKGMNPYVGLENYVDYKTCGIGKGKLIDGVYQEDTSETPKYYAIEHLNKHIKAKELWSSTIFTDEVLRKLDEKIKVIFEFPDPMKAQMEEIDEIIGINTETGEILDYDDDDILLKS